MVDVVYRLAPESVKLLERVRIPSSTPVISPCSSMVEHIFGKDETGVQFTTRAPNFEIDVEMSPLYSSALYLEHDTPVELYKVCINSPIRDKPVSL